MHLDVDVRFYGDSYNQIGRGHAEIRCDHEENSEAVLIQLSLALQPLIEGLVKHARYEAIEHLAREAAKTGDAKESQP